MFIFKKIIAPIFFPVSICIELIFFGLILLLFTKKQKAGKLVISMGAILFVILSFGLVPDTLLHPLEYKFPPISDTAKFTDVKWVVVLGGGHRSDPILPATSQIGDSSLFRLVEGIRLHRMIPGSKLLLSGGGAFDPVPNAQIMAEVALELGVDRNNMMLESASKDTKDEARIIKNMVGQEKFFLVTSASHMPRSIALFEKKGMRPIPASTDYRVKKRQAISPASFFPEADNLRKSERAFYEYLGLLWSKIRGQI